MTIEQLHTITEENWERIVKQFSAHYGPTLTFVTENKGSLSEGRDIYVDAFIYYTQLIELQGPSMLEKAEGLIYSFARKLWVKRLSKRNVDVNFVKHRREYFEMEEAFHDIDSINERTIKTSQKLAELGEPYRTLISEHIGKSTPLDELYGRLGLTNEDRAFSALSKSVRRLVKIIDKKEFNSIDDTTFEKLVRYVIDNPTAEFSEWSKDEKVCLTIISRSFSMIKNHVERKKRKALLDELKVRFEPETEDILHGKHASKKQGKMKPIWVFGLTATLAILISTITSFGILKNADKTEEPVAELVDTVAVEEPVIEVFEALEAKTAFLIDSKGHLLTRAIENTENLVLRNNDLDKNLLVSVLYTDTVLDLSILHCEELAETKVPFRVAPDDARIGQPLFTVGLKDGEIVYEEGYLNSSNNNGFGRSKLESMPVGAPVLSDRGQLLGIITEKQDDNLCRLVKSSEIMKMVDTYTEMAETDIKLPNRNKLFYSDRTDQLAKLTPCVFDVVYESVAENTFASNEH